jgi:capping protein beta
VFQIYRELYFGKSNSVSSVYLWDKEEGDNISAGFAGCFLIQNKVDDNNYWNSIHVVDVGQVQKGKCQYKLTSTLLLSITPSEEEVQSTNISGSLIRHNVRECKVEDDNSSHIINIGKFIEDMESEMRSEMDSLYIQKTKNVVEMLRQEGQREKTEGQEHTKVLNEAVLAMAMNRKAKLDDK